MALSSALCAGERKSKVLTNGPLLAKLGTLTVVCAFSFLRASGAVLAVINVLRKNVVASKLELPLVALRAWITLKLPSYYLLSD